MIRGQYDGYRKRARASTQASETETFVALRAEVDNWRWKGVPFYLRTGKCLHEARQVVTIGPARADDADLPARGRRARPARATTSSSTSPTPASINVDFLAKRPRPAAAARHGAR